MRVSRFGPGACGGLSIVELLVGLAIGLFVLAAASTLATNQIVDNKRMLLETQVQQDMRSAMDIIVRDIRRSGFSASAQKMVQGVEATPLAPLPDFHPAGYGDGDLLSYSYAKNESESNVKGPDDERKFRFDKGGIDVYLGLSNWQTLTDRNVLRITEFTATPKNVTKTWLPVCKTPPCASDPPDKCDGGQYITTRDIELVMTGEAVHDPKVKRTVRANVRVRNDEVCR